MAVNIIMTFGDCDTESHVVHSQHQTGDQSALLCSAPPQSQLSTETLRFQ